MREIEERKRENWRKRGREIDKGRQRERDRNKVEISTYLFLK